MQPIRRRQKRASKGANDITSSTMATVWKLTRRPYGQRHIRTVEEKVHWIARAAVTIETRAAWHKFRLLLGCQCGKQDLISSPMKSCSSEWLTRSCLKSVIEIHSQVKVTNSNSSTFVAKTKAPYRLYAHGNYNNHRFRHAWADCSIIYCFHWSLISLRPGVHSAAERSFAGEVSISAKAERVEDA